MDGGADRHSIFAKNFIDILSENQDYLLGRQLSNVLSARVLNRAKRWTLISGRNTRRFTSLLAIPDPGFYLPAAKDLIQSESQNI
jgi:hypothetical protein